MRTTDDSFDAERISAGTALWNQREALARRADTIVQLCDKAGLERDLSLPQWTQLMAFALEFQPDLILELGRYLGNSTCAFLEVVDELGADTCKIESLCITDRWSSTRRRLASITSEDWYAPLDAHVADILHFDYEALFQDARRVLVFWDAHGFDVAGCVLGRILPLLADRPHVVAMHDISDARYGGPQQRLYGDQEIWKGINAGKQQLRLGHFESSVAQSIAIYDFASRNGLPLHTADEELKRELGDNEDRLTTLHQLLGERLFALRGNWIWFSLNEISPPYTFPKFVPRSRLPWRQRLKIILTVARYGLLP